MAKQLGLPVDTESVEQSAKKKGRTSAANTSANLGFEAQLWRAADALRGSMDAAEYKHVVLGLIFLKYISDAFEEHRKRLLEEPNADPEDPDEYRGDNVFWVPEEARWSYLMSHARDASIGQVVDRAMEAVERDNPSLKGVLPKDYARPQLDKVRLGQLIDLISKIQVGGEEARSRDVLGRVYEYFLSQFASAEGKKGGRVLHAALCGASAGGDAGAFPWAGLRPLLWFQWDVRTVGGVHRSTCHR